MSIALLAERDESFDTAPAQGADSQDPNPGRVIEIGEATAPTERKVVLVVDDDDAVRTTLCELLESDGYIVVEAQDGEEALSVLSSETVDLMLLDLAMPRLDGFGVLREMESPPPLVIVNSAFEYFSEEEIRERVVAKVFRYLHKPVPPQELLDEVKSAFE